jgi:hypothetical protein
MAAPKEAPSLVGWYTEFDEAKAPSAAPEPAPPLPGQRNPIHTFLGSNLSRTAMTSARGVGQRPRDFFPGALPRRARSDSSERSDASESSCATAPSPTSSVVEPPPEVKKRLAGMRTRRFKNGHANGEAAKEGPEEGKDAPERKEAPPVPPPRRSLSRAGDEAPTEPPDQLALAAAEAKAAIDARAAAAAAKEAEEAAAAKAAAEAEELWRIAAEEEGEAAEAAGAEMLAMPRLSRSLSSTTSAAQRCVLQCGLEVVLVLASFVDIDFLHQACSPPPCPRGAPRPTRALRPSRP